MDTWIRLLLTTIAIGVAACSSNGQQSDGGPVSGAHPGGATHVFVYDHVSGWSDRDVSGLSGPEVMAKYHVYLPAGGAWDDALRGEFSAYVHAGSTAAPLEPTIEFSNVVETPNVQLVTVRVPVSEAGTHWVAVNGAGVRPLRNIPGFVYAVEPPADLLPRYVAPGWAFRTIGSCPHPVEARVVKSADQGGAIEWEVTVSEPVSIADQSVLAKSSSDKAANAIELQLSQVGPKTLRVRAPAGGIAKTAYQMQVDPKAGLAGAFVVTGSCEATSTEIRLPAPHSVDYVPAVDYQELARRLAPHLPGNESK